jgi:hypothetical protein
MTSAKDSSGRRRTCICCRIPDFKSIAVSIHSPLQIGTRMIATALFLVAREPTTAPPRLPHVEYRTAIGSTADLTWQCPGSTISLSLHTDENGIRVIRFENGAGSATNEQIERWNHWLEGISNYDRHSFYCEREDNQAIDIAGTSATGSGYRVVSVWWRGGELGIASRVDYGTGNVRTRLPLD